jgi:hypothetical protein
MQYIGKLRAICIAIVEAFKEYLFIVKNLYWIIQSFATNEWHCRLFYKIDGLNGILK